MEGCACQVAAMTRDSQVSWRRHVLLHWRENKRSLELPGVQIRSHSPAGLGDSITAIEEKVIKLRAVSHLSTSVGSIHIAPKLTFLKENHYRICTLSRNNRISVWLVKGKYLGHVWNGYRSQ